MGKKLLLKDEGGFTLIEIIAVLVILGILAAVAVPKFFDLQTKAKGKTIDAAVAELKSRVNQQFARELLAGKTTPNYTGTIGDEITSGLGEDFTVENWTQTGGTITFTIIYQKGKDAEYSDSTRTITVPKFGDSV